MENGAGVDVLGGLQPGDVVHGQVVQQQAEVSSCRGMKPVGQAILCMAE